MKIRIPIGVIVVSIVLLLVIGFSSCSNCKKFVPYSPSVWSSESRFREGMTGGGANPVSYSTYPDNQSVSGTMDTHHVNNTVTTQGAGAANPPGVRLHGFGSALFSGSDNDQSIDSFGPDPGSLQCFDRSFGLSKSTGPLCVTDKQYQMLTTRGGNA